MSDDWKKDRVASARRWENPMVLARVPSGYACIGDNQFLPGYCVLNSDSAANHLTDLPLPERTQFLADMSLLGEAIMRACSPLRVNYSVYGNTDHFLHAHVIPRYDWEDAERVKMPVWLYPPEWWTRPDIAYSDERHGEMRERIRAALTELMRQLTRSSLRSGQRPSRAAGLNVNNRAGQRSRKVRFTVMPSAPSSVNPQAR